MIDLKKKSKNTRKMPPMVDGVANERNRTAVVHNQLGRENSEEKLTEGR